jgi:hypothetical protein
MSHGSVHTTHGIEVRPLGERSFDGARHKILVHCLSGEVVEVGHRGEDR